MSEQDHNWKFKIGGEPFEMTHQNGSLYTFIGKTVINGLDVPNENFNHVFLIRSRDDEKNEVRANHVFRDDPAFTQLAQFMMQHDYPMILNMHEVPQCDIDAWTNRVFRDLGDYPPEWT